MHIFVLLFLVVPYHFVKISAQRLIIYDFLFLWFPEFMFLFAAFSNGHCFYRIPHAAAVPSDIYCDFLVLLVFTTLQHYTMSDSVRYIHIQEQAVAVFLAVLLMLSLSCCLSHSRGTLRRTVREAQHARYSVRVTAHEAQQWEHWTVNVVGDQNNFYSVTTNTLWDASQGDSGGISAAWFGSFLGSYG